MIFQIFATCKTRLKIKSHVIFGLFNIRVARIPLIFMPPRVSGFFDVVQGCTTEWLEY